MVKKARDMGLTIPVVLMGYYNPFFQYGLENLCAQTKENGAHGFIVVDLPPRRAPSWPPPAASTVFPMSPSSLPPPPMLASST